LERKPDLEQVHLFIAAPWPSATDPNRYAASLLSAILGGGTSSRLWQAIREERGLAYSVGAGGTAFADVGVFSVYAGTSPRQVDEVVELSLRELRRVVREAVRADELQLFKEQAISSILLGLESSSARAGTLARQEIVHGCHVPPDDIIKRLEAVTVADVQGIAQQYFKTENMAFAALGNLNGFKIDRAGLEI
jgi:predicted Zn-dependent peptidase